MRLDDRMMHESRLKYCFLLLIAIGFAPGGSSAGQGMGAPKAEGYVGAEPDADGEGERVVARQVSSSLLGDVIGPSLFGPLRPEAWRPLGLGGFFREGWNEPYAPVPHDTPRQTWVNSADGAFYRLFVFSFSFARGVPGNANAYNGSYILFTPLSRRFEIGWIVPFVNSAPDAAKAGPKNYMTDFGDLTIAPRFLLAEDKNYTVTTNLFIRTPTGDARIGNGAMTLSPDLEFWVNPVDRWVVRGAVGVTVPTNETPIKSRFQNANPWFGFNEAPASFSSFDARLAIGQYITPADAPIFKNFVYDLAANLHTEISGGNKTFFSLAPGFRFGLGKEWYVLGAIEAPLVGPLPYQTQTTFQIIKNF